MEKAILDLVKERLGNSKHKLVCLSCGKYESVQKTNAVNEPIICPLCRSRLITETYVSDLDLPRIIQKKKKAQPLTEDEEKKYRRAWKTSSLIQNFGKRAYRDTFRLRSWRRHCCENHQEDWRRRPVLQEHLPRGEKLRRDQRLLAGMTQAEPSVTVE